MDDRVRRLVLSRPIPDKLIKDLADAPLVEEQINTFLRGRSRKLTPALIGILIDICSGYTEKQIAEMHRLSEDAVKDRTKRLLALYRARNRTHLVATVLRNGTEPPTADK